MRQQRAEDGEAPLLGATCLTRRMSIRVIVEEGLFDGGIGMPRTCCEEEFGVGLRKLEACQWQRSLLECEVKEA